MTNKKLIIVTGGKGILGSSICRYLKENGYEVIIFDLPEVDITKDSDIIYYVDLIRRTNCKNIYGLINCAAIDFPSFSDYEYSEELWNKVMDVNIRGTYRCSELVYKDMIHNGEGSIINISSVYGMVSPDHRIYDDGFMKPIEYSVSKSAIYNMTRCLAVRYAKYNIRVNTLTLGGIYSGQKDSFVKKYSDRVPLGRMANEGEYNGIIKFLLSKDSSYITGANIVADGGLTAW